MIINNKEYIEISEREYRDMNRGKKAYDKTARVGNVFYKLKDNLDIESIIAARKCMCFSQVSVKCKNLHCLNKSCPLNKEYD